MHATLATFALGVNWPTLVFALVAFAIIALLTARLGIRVAVGALAVALLLLLLTACAAAPGPATRAAKAPAVCPAPPAPCLGGVCCAPPPR